MADRRSESLLEALVERGVLRREERRRSRSGPCQHDKTSDGRCSRWVELGIPCDVGPPQVRYVSDWQILSDADYLTEGE